MNDHEKKCYEEMYQMIAERAENYTGAEISQTAVWEGEAPAVQPLLLQCGLPNGIADKFPDYNPGEIHRDKVKMLLSGMKGMLSSSLAGMQAVPSIRANMGCGIFPSMFPGILPLLFDDGKMPWVKKHLSREEIIKLSEDDVTFTDEFKLALEHMEYIAEKIEGTGARVYPLDVQGPFDTAHLVYGDEIFYGMYDEPELMHKLLDLCCRAIEKGYAECLKIIPGSDKLIAHYNGLVIPRSRGGIKLSEDTSTIISADHIDEFVVPYTKRVLDFAGGGYIHYCGKNSHLYKRVLEMDNAYGINFGNPDFHDMDAVLKDVARLGKIYYGGLQKPEGESHREFFSRIKKAASANGRCGLLFNYYAEYEDVGIIKESWGK